MNYHLVFDASQNGSRMVAWAFPLIFALMFGLIGRALKGFRDSRVAEKGGLFMMIAGCGFVVCLAFLANDYSEYQLAKKALKTREYQVVEGTVTDFLPLPPGGHSTESFRVGNVPFSYGEGWGSALFNSDWNRGFIHDGAQVRITSTREGILRVETR